MDMSGLTGTGIRKMAVIDGTTDTGPGRHTMAPDGLGPDMKEERSSRDIGMAAEAGWIMTIDRIDPGTGTIVMIGTIVEIAAGDNSVASR